MVDKCVIRFILQKKLFPSCYRAYWILELAPCDSYIGYYDYFPEIAAVTVSPVVSVMVISPVMKYSPMTSLVSNYAPMKHMSVNHIRSVILSELDTI